MAIKEKFIKTTRFLIPFIITLVIIFFLFSKINYQETIAIFSKTDKPLIILAILIIFLTMPVSALRWKTLIKSAGYEVSYKTVFINFLSNVPFAKIIPANIGDLGRAVHLKKEVPISVNMGIILLENFLDILILIIFMLISGLIFKIKTAAIISLIALFFIALIIILSFFALKINLFNEKWKEKITNFIKILADLPKKPFLFYSSIVYSILSCALILICFKIIFYALNINVPFLYIFANQPTIIFLGLAPITISGIGIRESMMLIAYQSIAASPIILTAGLIYSFSAAILLPLICLPLLFIKLWKIN